MWMSLVEMKVWMRGRSESLTAFQAASMSWKPVRASGLTLQAIADTLNREGVPTLRGGAKWRPSSVQAATGYKRPSRHPEEPLA